MDAARYASLRRQARALARNDSEADDLLQDALLAAHLAQRDDARWLTGVLRNLARMQARSAVRRRAREAIAAYDVTDSAAYGADEAALYDAGADAASRACRAEAEAASRTHCTDAEAASRTHCTGAKAAFRARRTGIGATSALPALPVMPAAARRVARFALHGLDADEIRWLLGATPAAFRQRTASIRRALQALPAAQREAWVRAIERHQPPRASGPLRRTLKAAIGPADGLASHDPDGHPLVLRNRAHAWTSRGNVGRPSPKE